MVRNRATVYPSSEMSPSLELEPLLNPNCSALGEALAGELGALLRREEWYSSNLSGWRPFFCH